MKIAIITIAGVSSRFNEGIPEEDKKHKIIYYNDNPKDTLLYHLIDKCMYADKIILVGGNKFDDVKAYCDNLTSQVKDKIVLVYNEHYADLASGYSLYVGLNELFKEYNDVEEVLFVEGDLDIDSSSFNNVIASSKNVLTYSYEPIYANKAVVLYKDKDEKYKYAFNSTHGLLNIEEPFSCMLNSGQVWKFNDVAKLNSANIRFYKEDKAETNLLIIQNYIDLCDSEEFDLIPLKRWTNCNTREDYRKIVSYWKEEI